MRLEPVLDTGHRQPIIALAMCSLSTWYHDPLSPYAFRLNAPKLRKPIWFVIEILCSVDKTSVCVVESEGGTAVRG